ncbi:MAG: hypothetical protein D6806_14065 [Deltaproteobacteria bacterium]|nr:MAG: hypothetical protein D6806_14065 [Deltaproteobacteria bacterium]
MGISNVKLKPLKNVPPFRKVALGTWHGPGDPQIYGTLEIDLTNAYRWRDSLPEGSPRVTVTHMVARAVAVALARYPDLNAMLRFGRIYLRQSVDMFILAAVEHESGREDLTSIKLSGADKMSVEQIAEVVAAKLKRVREKKDTELQKTSRMMSLMPGWLVRFLLKLVAFISYTLNLRFPGIPRDQFGSCLITNVGMMGLDIAYAPLVPYSRAPVVLLVGEAKPRPVVVGDKIEIRPVVTLNASIDHRLCDGALLAKMVKTIKTVFAEPEKYFEVPEVTGDSSGGQAGGQR